MVYSVNFKMATATMFDFSVNVRFCNFSLGNDVMRLRSKFNQNCSVFVIVIAVSTIYYGRRRHIGSRFLLPVSLHAVVIRLCFSSNPETLV
jgi:hypothetical protein